MIKAKNKKKKEESIVLDRICLDYKYQRQYNQCDEDCRETAESILDRYLPVYIESLTNNKYTVDSYEFDDEEEDYNSDMIYKIEIYLKKK